jgi:hydroxypyruvate isomerase
MMFREAAFLERFARAAQAGFAGVEIQDLSAAPVAHIQAAAADAGIDVVLINVSVGDALTGGFGLSGVPGREAAFRNAFAAACDAAAKTNAHFVHLGPSRVPPGLTRAACLSAYRANMDFCLNYAQGARFTLLVEALNKIEWPDILIDRVDLAATLAREREGGVGLLYDMYHAAMNGDDIISAYARHRDVIRHIQFADAPGRGEPGSGGLDFGSIFEALAASGYAGWLGAEYVSRPQADATFAWLEPAAAAFARQRP